MTYTTRAFAFIGVLVLTFGMSVMPAAAQNPSRSFGGLFGGRAGSQQQPKQTLDLSLTVLEAYDDNILAEQGTISPSAPAIGGWYTMFGGDGAYQWNGQRTQFGLTGGAVGRYYTEDSSTNVSATAGVGFSTELGRRTKLTANQTIAYSPSYLTGLFPEADSGAPGASPPVGASYAVDDEASFQYGTSLALRAALTQRGTLTGSVDYAKTDFTGSASPRTDQSDSSARVQYSQSVSRNASLRVAYRYRESDLGRVPGLAVGSTTTENGFDVGVDYVRPLSATRRLTMSFGVGSSAAEMPTLLATRARQYRAIGDAALAYQFKRTWSLVAGYKRGLDYIPELARPVYNDAVSAGVSGLLTSRMDLNVTAGLSTGESSSLGQSAGFDTYLASARLRRGLTRTLAAYLEYVYYYYDFGAAQVQPGVPPTMERNGVRVGLTWWIPALRR